jgi:hypothetical protein
MLYIDTGSIKFNCKHLWIQYYNIMYSTVFFYIIYVYIMMSHPMKERWKHTKGWLAIFVKWILYKTLYNFNNNRKISNVSTLNISTIKALRVFFLSYKQKNSVFCIQRHTVTSQLFFLFVVCTISCNRSEQRNFFGTTSCFFPATVTTRRQDDGRRTDGHGESIIQWCWVSLAAKKKKKVKRSLFLD